MPSIHSRLNINNPELESNLKPVASPATNVPPAPSLSLHEPIFQSRSLTPPEYMYAFDTDRVYPASFTFRRRSVDSNSQIRNTALQALAKALNGSIT